MPAETPEFELRRLRRQQTKAREDEVFGGMSLRELAEYDDRTKRINELEIEIAARGVATGSEADQRRQWNRSSETDNSQETRQPYRSRENDSSTGFSDSQMKRKAKNAGDPRDDEKE